MSARHRMTYQNTRRNGVVLIIEPWANELSIEPGQKVEILVEGGIEDGVFELEQTPGGLTICGYEGCTIRVLRGGEDLI
jgi:hypothetical protein